VLGALGKAGIHFKDLQTSQRSLEEIFVSLVSERRDMNLNYAIRAIYLFEMARTWRTVLQSIVSPRPLDLAVLRRLRRGHRLAHAGDRRHQLSARSSCRD
jgi:hypothetical protein